MVASAEVPTVLVVDDEEPLRIYMARVLEDEGYIVIKAENGLEALSLLEDRDTGKIHLVITDVLMPGMGGMDLATRMARHQSAPPILFVSGSHSVSDLPGPLLKKPFLPADLSALAGNLLRETIGLPQA